MIIIPEMPSIVSLVQKIETECPDVISSGAFGELRSISEKIDKIREFFQFICNWMDTFMFRDNSRMGGYKAIIEEYFREARLK